MDNKILENLKELSDWDLLELLFCEKDTLPRAVVNEFIFRGERMIEPLWEIIKDTNNWEGDEKNWWAVIHATFILGAIGTKETITPLIMSLRFSDAYNCDWVQEKLPSIFGRIGPAVLEPLKRIALDKSNNWFIRVGALEGIAAVTIKNHHFEQEVFDFIAQFLKDSYEDRMVRGLAGSILLDFKQRKYERALLDFAKEEEELKEEDPDYYSHLEQETVLEDFKSDEKDSWHYTRDWLKFYNNEEIEKRQDRWRKEKAWWGKLAIWWDIQKIKMNARKYLKDKQDKNNYGTKSN